MQNKDQTISKNAHNTPQIALDKSILRDGNGMKGQGFHTCALTRRVLHISADAQMWAII
jgi:hypothetical protein